MCDERNTNRECMAYDSATSIFFVWYGGEGYILFIKNLQITTVFLAIYPDKLCEKEVALHTLLFFLFYTFIHHTSSR